MAKKVRFYHGGSPDNTGTRWVSQQEDYAKWYAKKNAGSQVFYIDLPDDHPLLVANEAPYSNEPGAMKNIKGDKFYANFDLPHDLAMQMKPLEEEPSTDPRDVNQEGVESAVKHGLEQIETRKDLSPEQKAEAIAAIQALLKHEMPAVDWKELFPPGSEDEEAEQPESSTSSVPAGTQVAPAPTPSGPPQSVSPSPAPSATPAPASQSPTPTGSPAATSPGASPQAAPVGSLAKKIHPRNVGPRRKPRSWFQKLLPEWHRVMEGMPNQWKDNQKYAEQQLAESQRLAVKHRQQAAAATDPDVVAKHLAHAGKHEHNIEQQKLNIAHWSDTGRYAMNLLLPEWASFMDLDRPEEFQGNAPQVQMPTNQAQVTPPTAGQTSALGSPTPTAAPTQAVPTGQPVPQSAPAATGKKPKASPQQAAAMPSASTGAFAAQMPEPSELESPTPQEEMPTQGTTEASGHQEAEHPQIPEYQGAESASEKSHFPSMAGAMTEDSNTLTSNLGGSSGGDDLKDLAEAIKALTNAVEANTEAVKEMASSQKSGMGSHPSSRKTVFGGNGPKTTIEMMKQAKEAVAGAGNAMMGRTGGGTTSRPGPARQGGGAQAAGARVASVAASEVVAAVLPAVAAGS